MERLTYRDISGIARCKVFRCMDDCEHCDHYRKILNKLAYYEDLEEKGKLIALSSDENQLDMIKHRCKLCLCWDGECKSWNKTECPVYIKIKELSK